MTIEQLRKKHPRFIYRRFSIQQSPSDLTLTYEFVLEPDLVFRPKITIPYVGSIDTQKLGNFVFHIGLVEMISYWKCACSPEIVIEAGVLEERQIEFFRTLLIHGLGEFFYQNSIDFTATDFVTLISTGKRRLNENHDDKKVPRKYEGNLLLVGGGKDSTVTLELLRQMLPLGVLAVNPRDATRDIVNTTHIRDPLYVTRMIDPLLFELNQMGYLNGHTPYSAMLSFLAVLVGYIYGYANVIVSNERSANEGNVYFHGVDINHQYSKSYEYEKSFRSYVASYFFNEIDDHPLYFSFLRPISDLQIAKIFSHYPQYFKEFRSCNVGVRTNAWCGQCAKCAFTYLALSAFLSSAKVHEIFGGNYFEREKILHSIRQLVGLEHIKPFECVGTKDESMLAVYLTVHVLEKEKNAVPEGLAEIYHRLSFSPSRLSELMNNVLKGWDTQHFLPFAHENILKRTLGIV